MLILNKFSTCTCPAWHPGVWQRARGNKFYPGLPADHAALRSPASAQQTRSNLSDRVCQRDPAAPARTWFAARTVTHSTDRVRARDHVGPPAPASPQQTMSLPAPASRCGARLTGPGPRVHGGHCCTAGHGPVGARERERGAVVCSQAVPRWGFGRHHGTLHHPCILFAFATDDRMHGARTASPLTPLLLPSTGMAEPPALGTGAAGVDGHVDWSAVDQFQSADPLPVDDGQHLEQHSPQHSPQQPLQQPPQQRRQQHSMQAAAPAMLNNTVTLHKATSSFPLDHAFVGDAVRQLSRALDYRRDLLRVRMEDFVAFRSTAAQVILFRATAFFAGEV